MYLIGGTSEKPLDSSMADNDLIVLGPTCWSEIVPCILFVVEASQSHVLLAADHAVAYSTESVLPPESLPGSEFTLSGVIISTLIGEWAAST